MLRNCLYIFLLACVIAPAPAGAAEGRPGAPAYMQDDLRPAQNGRFERGAVLYLEERREARYQGEDVPSRKAQRQDHGLVLPDGRGGLILLPGAETAPQNPNVVDARELKLKMRELAAQLVAGLGPALSGQLALPTSFVQQDDFERTSSFGRFIAEQLFYEFNQRGLRTREYRLAGSLSVREDGEFILSREVAASPLAANTLYVVGTYYTDGQVLFLNARLLRANGDILRTGQLILQVNPLTRRMLANSGRRMREGNLELKDFNSEARQPGAVTAFDQGLDIH